MNYRIKAYTLATMLCAALTIVACKPTPQPQASSANANQPVQPTAPARQAQPVEIKNDDDGYKSVYKLFTDEDHLSYKGFELIKRRKNVKFEPGLAPMPLSYAVLKQGRKVVAEFHHDFGPLHATEFGLFPFLGGQTEQVIVAQTAPRMSHFWIISLDAGFRVLFDSTDYATSREEPWIVDSDKDGIYEIAMATLDFDAGIKACPLLGTPQPLLIFKYNKQAGRYLIANHTLRDYTLKGIDDEIKTLSKPDPIDHECTYFEQRVSILLRYVYAGQQAEGWAFFDKAYTLPDKEKVRARVKAILHKQRAYRSIYGKRAT